MFDEGVSSPSAWGVGHKEPPEILHIIRAAVPIPGGGTLLGPSGAKQGRKC